MTISLIPMVLLIMVFSLLSIFPAHAENKTQPSADGLHASIQPAIPSPEWVRALPAARDESVHQLFIVAGISMNSTAATVSMHQRNENGEWMRILSTPGYVGKNGLCMDADRVEGCGKTPIGTYRFTAAFGIAEDPGYMVPYLQVDDDIYWSGDDNHAYNEMVRLSETPDLDIQKSERIMDYEYEYQYCMNIGFNEEGTPGRGSAIFLHCLGREKPYTGGCVAIPENIMKLVLQQVQPDCVVLIGTMESLHVSF